jgi:hypothetical protein
MRRRQSRKVASSSGERLKSNELLIELSLKMTASVKKSDHGGGVVGIGGERDDHRHHGARQDQDGRHVIRRVDGISQTERGFGQLPHRGLSDPTVRWAPGRITIRTVGGLAGRDRDPDHTGVKKFTGAAACQKCRTADSL